MKKVLLLLCLALFSKQIVETPPMFQEEPKREKKVVLTDKDCLAYAIFHEARGEGEEGMRAVASVIFNRAKKQRKPLCAVIKLPSSFPLLKLG